MSKVKINGRVVISKPGQPVQTAGGGLTPGVPVAAMSKWAAVEARSGSLQVDSAQREWNYDYRITVRYTPSFVESSNDTVIYQGKRLIIRSVSFEEEGAKKFMVLRCSVNEQL